MCRVCSAIHQIYDLYKHLFYSVSVTMNQDDLKAITTIVASPSFSNDRLWLNGKEENITKNGRVQDVLREIRKRTGNRVNNAGEMILSHELCNWKVHIVSRNTFPTAAGLASSAAGYACLVHTLADVYAVKESYPGELSTIARQGSGSACRSLYGGFVRWDMGIKDDASDSMAIQIADENHWPELQLLILVVSDKKKETGSTDGMTRAVETSRLLAHRASSVVPGRLAAIEEAYKRKDFTKFAEITMQDSNQFHATCLDTYPPIFYMNDISARIISLAHKINSVFGEIRVGYTFDAGPNAVLFTLRNWAPEVLAVMLSHFPPNELVAQPFVDDQTLLQKALEAAASLPPTLICSSSNIASGSVRHIYVTSVGDGPRVLSDDEALADGVTGLPFNKETSSTEFSSGL
jgi:diphosphomevalonate decarboxylase